MSDLRQMFGLLVSIVPDFSSEVSRDYSLPSEVKGFSRIVDSIETGKSGGYSAHAAFLKYPFTFPSVQETHVFLMCRKCTINED
jgi:hypothetical protein